MEYRRNAAAPGTTGAIFIPSGEPGLTPAEEFVPGTRLDMRIHLQTTWAPAGTGDLYLDQFPCVVGRGEDCNFTLPVGFISRRHCRFIRRDGHVFVQDLESLNGTFVNGSLAVVPTPLRHGDELRMGPMSFRVLVVAADDAGTLCLDATSSEMSVY
jgi:pSer/pThr/pTyr-binding forkhead associated (FHA) protein